jgi:hypothetical protein
MNPENEYITSEYILIHIPETNQSPAARGVLDLVL